MTQPKTITLELGDGFLGGWPVLINMLKEAGSKTGYTMTFNGVIEQIEKQLPAPKPEEPREFAAVVRDGVLPNDRFKVQWVRTTSASDPGPYWLRRGTAQRRTWDDFSNKVEVQSEGVR